MKNVAFWTLICVNVLLAGTFVSRMSKPNVAVAAQAGGARPGDYIMIPGSVLGGVNDVIYILDQTSHQLSALSYDSSSNAIGMMKPPRDLDRDFDGTGNNRRGR